MITSNQNNSKVSGSVEMKTSSVAEALGTKFEVKASKPLSYSKSSGQVRKSSYSKHIA